MNKKSALVMVVMVMTGVTTSILAMVKSNICIITGVIFLITFGIWMFYEIIGQNDKLNINS
jgi:hypothetical protein